MENLVEELACELLTEIDNGTKTIAMDRWKFNSHLKEWNQISFKNIFLDQAKESLDAED